MINMSKENYAESGTERIDFARIRQMNPLLEYCQDHGFELRRSGSRWVGKCPLHNEQNGEAFVIHPDQKWQCYGVCARSGDVTDLEQELHGGTLAEAARRLEGSRPSGLLSQSSVTEQSIRVLEISKLLPTPDNPLALPYVLRAEDIRDCQRYSLRLLGFSIAEPLSPARWTLQDCEYLQMVAKARQWQQQTLHDLALDGYLGRDDDGRICFISASGCKSRWRENGARRFRFLFGKSWLWRGELIPGAETVYLCEGETDTVGLIDRGIEEDGQTVAVGLQGATLNIEPWAFLFTDKHVVIAMDDDAAGWKAAEKIERILATVSKSISSLHLNQEAA
jgi:CHC2-type zinc finger protein/Toprim domain-containing protein